MPKLYLFLLLISFAFGAKAVPVQKSAPKPKVKVVVKHIPAKVTVDSSALNARHFNQEALDKYAADPSFNYYTKNYKPELSLWDRFWKWFWKWIDGLFPDVNPGKPTPAIKNVLIGIAVIGLLFVIYKLLSSDLANMFSRESTQVTLPYNESLENIHEITFDEEIEKALAARNYKLAVRLLYLSSLKQLNDAKLIHWQIEKTNSAYVDELANTDQRQSFSVLTRQFEYIWYGNFPVDGQSFTNIQTLFIDFKKLLA